MTRRPVLIGEVNPYGDRPFAALLDLPAGSTGDRLRRLVCGLSTSRYRALPRYDLCRGAWSLPAARAEAQRIARFHPDDVLVLLGQKVVAAFAAPGTRIHLHGPFVSARADGVTHFDAGTLRFVTLPHPSGLSRVWHSRLEVERARALGYATTFLRARALLAAACPDVPFGEA